MARGPVLQYAIRAIPVHERDSLGAIRAIVETLSPDSLAALLSLANGRLDDGDPRKIRVADVRSLRRLALQAHAFDATLLEHAEDRRLLGEKRDDVSPEAADTARWAERLIRALEGMVRRYD
jgi:hypothetical protein